jgi:hypothetical protein
MLKNLSTERKSISEAMIFSIDHAESAKDIMEKIVDSIKNEETLLNKKARLNI